MVSREFQTELKNIINRYSVENECGMADYLVAGMICHLLDTLGVYFKRNLEWHGCDTTSDPWNDTTSIPIRSKDEDDLVSWKRWWADHQDMLNATDEDEEMLKSVYQSAVLDVTDFVKSQQDLDPPAKRLAVDIHEHFLKAIE